MDADKYWRKEGEEPEQSEGGAPDSERLETHRGELAELVDDIRDLPEILGGDFQYPRQSAERATSLHCVVRTPRSKISNPRCS